MIPLYPAIKSKMYINNEFKICQFRMKNIYSEYGVGGECPGNWDCQSCLVLLLLLLRKVCGADDWHGN